MRGGIRRLMLERVFLASTLCNFFKKIFYTLGDMVLWSSAQNLTLMAPGTTTFQPYSRLKKFPDIASTMLSTRHHFWREFGWVASWEQKGEGGFSVCASFSPFLSLFPFLLRQTADNARRGASVCGRPPPPPLSMASFFFMLLCGEGTHTPRVASAGRRSISTLFVCTF